MPTNTEAVEADIQRTAIFRYSPHIDRFVAEPDVAYGHDMLLEWQDLGGGVVKPLYIGTSDGEATATSAPLWTVQRFDWTYVSGVWKPTQIRVRLGAWDNRASLGW
jgi:hypothetical protein